MTNQKFFKTSMGHRVVVYNNNADALMKYHGAYKAGKNRWAMVSFSEDLKRAIHHGPSLMNIVEISKDEWLELHAKELLEEEPRFFAMAIEQAASLLESVGQPTLFPS